MVEVLGSEESQEVLPSKSSIEVCVVLLSLLFMTMSISLSHKGHVEPYQNYL